MVGRERFRERESNQVEREGECNREQHSRRDPLGFSGKGRR